MEIVYKKSSNFIEAGHSFCPGCSHGIAHNIMMDTIDEMGLAEKAILVYPVGCAANAMTYVKPNVVHAPHGRAPAVATGIKRCAPDKFVVLYQGDGDLAAIGMAETIHMANRGEHVTTIYINNTIYGMTGGQMAPTTMMGQITTTTREGRGLHGEGQPIKMCEMISTLGEPKFVARYALDNAKHVIEARKGIKKAFQMQVEDKGYAFIELLSMCPSNWHLSPKDSVKYMEEEVIKTFPLGVYKEEV
ncbi:MAG: thiamine pyrophosphate-dependent enzyme [Eubacteriaceae bacterium]|jgi:2-oxoglutarate ferredoxin oxidoreductase subunit beta|nr:thiamine pyrophosphate-dependent enzyme [Eubacteriaceae bacterium]